jgi:transcriptional regulator with XRE-family HTH domain
MSDDEELSEAASPYGRRVGERLRAIRRQKRLSLQDVEANSNQEFKASVLGAYERGERAISVPRLERLARYYSVPVDQLLPRSMVGADGPGVVDLTGRTGRLAGVSIDLTQLDAVARPEGEMLGRYLVMIQVQRQDFNGRVLTIRQDDLRAVACILGVEIDDAIDRLADLGLTHLAPTV